MTNQLAKTLYARFSEDEITELISVLDTDAALLSSGLKQIHQTFLSAKEDPKQQVALDVLQRINNQIENYGSYEFQACNLDEYIDVKEINTWFARFSYRNYLEVALMLLRLNETLGYDREDYIHALIYKVIIEGAKTAKKEDVLDLAEKIKEDASGYFGKYDKENILDEIAH